MRKSYSASDKRRYTKMFFDGAAHEFCGRSSVGRHHINKEFAKSLEIAYDALKIIQQQVWCEHDKS